MRHIVLVVLFLLFSGNLLAQSLAVVHGRVLATSGEPLSGVSILAGTNLHTLTDDQGRFTLKLPRDLATLTLTYSGFGAKTVKLNADVRNGMELAIAMTPTGQINEVTVSGVKRKSATATDPDGPRLHSLV